MTKKTSKRLRIRSPAVVKGFCDRFRQILSEVGITHGQLSEKLGGFSPQIFSRLSHAQVKTLPIDLFVRLVSWADDSGISLRWFVMGLGPLKKADIPAQPDIVQGMNQLVTIRFIMALAERASVDLSDIVGDSQVTSYVPDYGFVNLPVEKALEILIAQIGAPRSAEPGFRTVPPESVPTNTDWSKHYVPVIGRIAAGEGIDTQEASEYPPAWAGEFLVYDDAPPTAVAVRVSGVSMEPEYHGGDMVVVDPATPAGSGDVCCVILARDGVREARLKRLRLSGPYAILESLNPESPHATERIPRNLVVCAYSIVAHLPMLRPM